MNPRAAPGEVRIEADCIRQPADSTFKIALRTSNKVTDPAREWCVYIMPLCVSLSLSLYFHARGEYSSWNGISNNALIDR